MMFGEQDDTPPEPNPGPGGGPAKIKEEILKVPPEAKKPNLKIVK